MTKQVACLLGEDFEDSEFKKPFDALSKAGFDIEIIGAERGKKLSGKSGKEKAKTTASIDEVHPEAFDALFIPGGYSPDHLRADERFVSFVRDFNALDRPIFAICHGPQLLMAAGIVDEDSTLTAWKTVQSDLKYTGATVKDEAVVVDDQWVTSRAPQDLPAFCEAIVDVLSDQRERSTEEIERAGAPLH